MTRMGAVGPWLAAAASSDRGSGSAETKAAAWLVSASLARDPSSMRWGFVYFMTNWPNGTLYVGVTSDIRRRAWEHREGLIDGFTKRYGLGRLVYYERARSLSSRRSGARRRSSIGRGRGRCGSSWLPTRIGTTSTRRSGTRDSGAAGGGFSSSCPALCRASTRTRPLREERRGWPGQARP